MAFWAMWAHCWLMSSCHPLVPSSPSRSCVQSFPLPACIVRESCHDPGTDLCAWIYWTSWDSPGPTTWARLGLSEWHSVPWACQLCHTAWCHPQTTDNTTVSVFSEDVRVPVLITEGHHMSLVSIQTLTTTICVWSHNQFPVHQTVYPSNPYLSDLKRVSRYIRWLSACYWQAG